MHGGLGPIHLDDLHHALHVLEVAPLLIPVAPVAKL
jgi:hypothetical protein